MDAPGPGSRHEALRSDLKPERAHRMREKGGMFREMDRRFSKTGAQARMLAAIVATIVIATACIGGRAAEPRVETPPSDSPVRGGVISIATAVEADTLDVQTSVSSV